jgi:hypothetical protein
MKLGIIEGNERGQKVIGPKAFGSKKERLTAIADTTALYQCDVSRLLQDNAYNLARFY